MRRIAAARRGRLAALSACVLVLIGHPMGPPFRPTPAPCKAGLRNHGGAALPPNCAACFASG